MIQEQRETIGAIIRSKKFMVHLACFIGCAAILVLMSSQELWIGFFLLNKTAVKGLLFANHMAFMASFCIIVSWILADDISWFGKAAFLFVTGILMTVCGAYYTIKFLNLGKEYYAAYVLHHHINTLWLPIVGAVNFILGIFTILLFVYVLLTLDS